MKLYKILKVFYENYLYCFSLFLVSCGGSNSSGGNSGGTQSVDITNAIFTSNSANCEDYAKSYTSSVNDIGRNVAFSGSLSITTNNGKCIFSSNAIPNHNFNDGVSFAANVATQNQVFEITNSPTFAANTTNISLSTDNAVFLNGAKLDLLAAACYGVGPDPIGQEKIGCNDDNQPFRYDPMHSGNNFGTDSHNAHTQPDGTYHYHGNPKAMFNETPASGVSPVIGFAADGFPIFGSFFNDNGTIRAATSGYELKSGTRQAQTYNSQFYNPGGTYDGTYVDDYQYTGNGDLDECNGMTIDGVYGYYVTNSYPWILNCFKGIPDSSFNK